MTSVLTAGLVFYQNGMTSLPGQQAAGGLNLTGVMLTAQEAAKHNSASDCWLIINNKVYDVSSYLSFHPGNPDTITPYCGKEATNAFDTKNQGKPHSQQAGNLLTQYYLGDLGQQANPQTPKPAPSPPIGRFEDD